jgi:hypothetical protein
MKRDLTNGPDPAQAVQRRSKASVSKTWKLTGAKADYSQLTSNYLERLGCNCFGYERRSTLGLWTGIQNNL